MPPETDEEKAARITAEEKARQDIANKNPGISDDELDKRVRKVVADLYAEVQSSRYIDCPSCGDRILRKNGTCKRCRTKFNVKSGVWEQDAPETIDDTPEFLR